MPYLIYFAILAELFVVSVGDIRENKIPNIFALINLVLAVFLFIFFPHLYVLRAEVFIYSLGFLSVGFVFFLMKIMGAGDVKYLFTFFLLVPFHFQDSTFLYLLLTTVVIGSFMLLNNTIRNFDRLKRALLVGDAKGVKSCFGSKFPYAPVILISWLWLGITYRNQLHW